MYLALSIVYCLVCAFLIFVVLLQQGRGGGMGALGGGGSQTVFGGAGAGNVLTRITSVCAALFMLLSATLAYMSSSSDSNLEDISAEIEASQTPTAISGSEESSASVPAAEEAPAVEDAEEEAAPAEEAPAAEEEAAPAEEVPAAPAAEEAPAQD